jgi:hypothetical protein
MSRQPRHSQAVRKLVADQAGMLYRGPSSYWSLRSLASYVTVLAYEASLINADQSIDPRYVRRVIAEDLASYLWVGCAYQAVCRHSSLPKRKRS